MKVKILVIFAAVAGLVGCGKNDATPASKAISHVADEAQKKTTETQLKGKWESPCDAKGLLWEAAGIRSEKITYDFYSGTGKTATLYSDDKCQTPVGEAIYTGTAIVGTPPAIEGTNILDLNYTAVSVKISDENVVKALNSALVPSCGINDWAVGAPRDVTAATGSANCPIVKPSQSFDIVKTDGATLHLGLADAGHDKTTQEKRPIALDTPKPFSKK